MYNECNIFTHYKINKISNTNSRKYIYITKIYNIQKNTKNKNNTLKMYNKLTIKNNL